MTILSVCSRVAFIQFILYCPPQKTVLQLSRRTLGKNNLNSILMGTKVISFNEWKKIDFISFNRIMKGQIVTLMVHLVSNQGQLSAVPHARTTVQWILDLL